jgi:hypothetical protein
MAITAASTDPAATPSSLSPATADLQACHICGESRGPIFEVYAYTFVCRRCKSDEKLVAALVRWNQNLDRERR